MLFIFSYLPGAWFHLHLWNNRADLPWAQTSGYARSWQSLLASSATHTFWCFAALGLVGGSPWSHCSPPWSSWWTFPLRSALQIRDDGCSGGQASLGTIFLPGNKVLEHPCNEENPGKFLFEVVPGGDRDRMTANHESYLLMASTQNDMEDWVKSIRRVIWGPFGGGEHILKS